jgi:Family of unknown function (DUF6519)
MGSDRARVTYDPTRMWRGVIAQQGRVSLEADWNESIDIQNAAVRDLTLDVVGPEGTPDCGYAVSSVSAHSSGSASHQDLNIAPGVLYLGGERLQLSSAIKYSSQPDWLDSATDPTYTAISAIPTSTTEELVYLTATEQEVSAVEDPALSDVAIGGPDTGQRLRILQRVRRFATTATTCSNAFTQLQTQWTKQGYTFDQSTMRLASTATLKVGFSTSPTPGTPCQPAATGGYVWPDNQMYRVEIVALDTSGKPIIAWGPDDASFIYRATASPESGGTTTLTLATAPVDSNHYPQQGQAVQLLASAVQLAPAVAPNIASYVASPTGIVTTLNSSYQQGSQQIALKEPTAGPIPAAYFNTSATPQLFVRIWQGTGTAIPGTPFDLKDTQNNVDTGLTVTLESASGFHVGDFWRFALRPIEPAQIYPARYLAGAQPPDGPQTWAGPLAIINWSGTAAPRVTDCRPCFLSLTGGIQLTEVLAKDDDDHDIPLKNGMELRAQNLSKGLRLLLNQDVNPATVNEPACFVTFQLPYPLIPLNKVDQSIWGSSLIGYQPLVLPADVTTESGDETILWQPLDHIGLFFAGPDRLEAMKRRLPPSQFSKDWQVFDPPRSEQTYFPPSHWSYREDSVVQTAFTGDIGADTAVAYEYWGINTSCVSLNRLQANAYYIGLTANIYPTPPPSGPKLSWQNVGLIFNWVDENNYCLLRCTWEVGTAGALLYIDFVNVVNGRVPVQGRGSYFRVAQLSFPGLTNIRGILNTVSLNIKTTSAGLLVLVRAWFTSGSETLPSEVTFSLDPHQYIGVPDTLLKGSRVGMFTRFATAEFTRLEVVYPESRTVLIPRGGARVLATLTLKPDFLSPAPPLPPAPPPPPPAAPAPASASESSHLPSTCAGQSRSDFERWFWVLPPLIPYAYAYAYGYGLLEFLGVGPELLDEPGEGQ